MDYFVRANFVLLNKVTAEWQPHPLLVDFDKYPYPWGRWQHTPEGWPLAIKKQFVQNKVAE